MNRKIKVILIIAIAMFFLSLLSVKNDVCCMFASNRERGFPNKVLLISKETDNLQEAQKIYQLNDLELLNQGWELRLGSIFGYPAFWSITFNFLFYLIVSWISISLIEKIKRIYEKK
jgi:hypothetical protein